MERNVFALKPAPPPPDPSTTKPPPPKITPTGIANIFGTKRALMKVTEPAKPEPGKPPGPPQEQSYILAEGERQGEVEVLAIDDQAGTIKVNNSGTVMVLPLSTNLPPATAPPGSVPQPVAASLAPAPGSLAATPVAAIGATVPASPIQNPQKSTPIPARTLRLPTPAAPTAAATTQPTPTASLQAAPQEKPLTREEQIILMELEREKTAEQVHQGLLPPLPPTELTPR